MTNKCVVCQKRGKPGDCLSFHRYWTFSLQRVKRYRFCISDLPIRVLKNLKEMISSDDEPEAPRKRARCRNAEKILGEISLLTSDEDFEPIQPKKKKMVARKSTAKAAKIIGEISLLTSDEECEPIQPKKKKMVARKSTAKKHKTVKLLTSDNVIEKVKPSAAAKKRMAQNNETIVTNLPKKAKTLKPNALTDTIEDINPVWKESSLLAEKSIIDEEVAENLIKLWEEGNTIPFIARYRKNVIQNMTPEDLRTVKKNYDDICLLKKKMLNIVKVVSDMGKLNNKLQGNIFEARSMEELEHIYAPFKTDSKITLAERARRCGLEKPASQLLNNTAMVYYKDYINPEKGLKTMEDIEKGLIHILASEMATDLEVLRELRKLRTKNPFKLQTRKSNTINNEKIKNKTIKKGNRQTDPYKDESKFEIYFDFILRTDYLKSHQILAINRGEALKILSVKVIIPCIIEEWFRNFCIVKWVNKNEYDVQRRELLTRAIKDAYQRLVSPLIIREVRAELKVKAEKESCKVFGDNLKHLLLTPPIKGKSILGIDPGYFNGCKLALISPTGSLLAHNVVYPHSNKNKNRGEHVIKDMLFQHGCKFIGIGNGTACRKTEEWISGLINNKYFGNLDVQYVIVNEDGASIYSCSPEARKEFGDLDPNIISAVSLARRIQDPLAELVKVEPCHLGIGMYQLDIKKKQLEEALNEVVSECVSFVGVDVNTASHCLLRRVAGLSDKLATKIIDYRENIAPFTHRIQLLQIKGIGEQVYEQCIGFLKVCSTDPNKPYFCRETFPLDATIIHPESYSVVKGLLSTMKLKQRNIGTETFIRDFIVRSQELNFENLADSLKTDKTTLELIVNTLSKPLNHDLRTEISQRPLFKRGITSMQHLEIGEVLTGRVKNVTSFGAFVDCGMEKDGLIHKIFMKGLELHWGDVVKVRVKRIDLAKGHIQLEVIKKMF